MSVKRVANEHTTRLWVARTIHRFSALIILAWLAIAVFVTIGVPPCTAHKTNGDQCERWAIAGGFVCPAHGGRAFAVKAKARLRLEMASDRLARELLNMTTDPNVADPVKLAAIKDALDRSGIQAKTAVSVDVSVKPFEKVFDRIVARPREAPTALAELPESSDIAKELGQSDSNEIVGEFDDDEIQDDPYVPIFHRERESADVVDVEIVNPERYTDEIMSDHPHHTRPRRFVAHR
jgi:hypothetical protein